LRIAILTQYYPPEVGAPQHRLSDLARRLAGRGHQVRVLTALPNYPGTQVLPEYRGRRLVREEIEGVPVARLWLYVPRRKTFARRLANYGSFALHAAWRGATLLERADVVITESPPLFLGPAGAYLARRLGARFVFNVSDLWPDSAVELGFVRDGVALRAARWIEEGCYARADAITGQSESIVAHIRSRFPAKRVWFLPNGVDAERWQADQSRDRVRQEFDWKPEEFIVGYAGLHGHAQALDQVLAAARRLGRNGVRFCLFGEGPCKEALAAAAGGMAQVSFYPQQPHARIPEVLAACDAGLVSLARGKVFEGVLPSKVFEVMASGRPVLLAGGGEAGRLVEEARCGVVTPPETPERLAEGARELAASPQRCAEWGANGRRVVLERFNRARIGEEFERFLCALA
jgi:glycosyltransferase involved in cell wall biosynthesis